MKWMGRTKSGVDEDVEEIIDTSIRFALAYICANARDENIGGVDKCLSNNLLGNIICPLQKLSGCFCENERSTPYSPWTLYCLAVTLVDEGEDDEDTHGGLHDLRSASVVSLS
jgi:hypothetical protein